MAEEMAEEVLSATIAQIQQKRDEQRAQGAPGSPKMYNTRSQVSIARFILEE